MKRSYTHMKEFGDRIKELREAGRTRQEIADELGLQKEQIKRWISRHNRKERGIQTVMIPRRRGRPRKDGERVQNDTDREIQRLRMENELLRDFLHLAGRRRGQG